jgi:hypothetical protein
VKRARVALATAVFAASVACAALSCGPAPTSCIARGTSTRVTGTATFKLVGTVDPPADTASVSVDVYDITPGCWYSGMQFRAVIGSCGLWVEAPGEAGAAEGGGAADEAEAGCDAGFVASQVAPGQSCELPVPGGTVTAAGLTGTLVVGGSVSIRLSGSIDPAGEAEAAAPVAFTWRFTGD